MMTTIVVLLAGVAGYLAGWVHKGLSCEQEMARRAGSALSAKLAMAKAAASLQEVVPDDLDTCWDEGQVGLIDNALHVIRANLWGSGRWYQHVRRGTFYEVLSYHVHLQASDLSLLRDNEELALYINTRDGRLSVRHPLEFHDGRFRQVPRTLALDAESLAALGDPTAGGLGRAS